MAAGAGSAAATSHSLARVDVTELHRSQWSTLKSIRLEALREAPSAFVTTRETELGRPSAYWEGQFTRATWVVAQDGVAQDGVAQDGPPIVGIASLALPDPESHPDCRFIESVWVEPGYRWRGVLRQMLDHLEGRAKEDGATELLLWVLDTNESAQRAYHKLGFGLVVDRKQDTTKRRADGTFVKERLMSKPIL